MNPVRLIEKIRESGFTIEIKDGKVTVTPRDALTTEQVRLINGQMPLIRAALEAEIAAKEAKEAAEACPPCTGTATSEQAERAKEQIGRVKLEPPVHKSRPRRYTPPAEGAINSQLDAIVGASPFTADTVLQLVGASGPPLPYFFVPNLLVDRLISEEGVRQTEVMLLLYLCRQWSGSWGSKPPDGLEVTTGGLAKSLRLSKTTVVKTLAVLEKRGLIRREGTAHGPMRKGESERTPQRIWLTFPEA